jgi:hypothetical protein
MTSDRASNPLQSVNTGRPCPGCGASFQPTRRNQRHCRPSCRVLAWQRRPRPGESYDDRQLAAPLVRCAGCGREYFMTAPGARRCVECQR